MNEVVGGEVMIGFGVLVEAIGIYSIFFLVRDRKRDQFRSLKSRFLVPALAFPILGVVAIVKGISMLLAN